MASVLIASMSSSTVVIRNQRTWCGSARWSMATSAPSAHFTERSAIAATFATAPHSSLHVVFNPGNGHMPGFASRGS